MFFMFGLTGFAQQKDKKQSRKEDRHEKRLNSYKAVREIIESKDFIFDAKRVFPTGHRSMDLISNPGTIIVKNDSVTADLPYFGRAYTSGYGGEAGMKFSGKMTNEKLEFQEDKYKIRYSFTVQGENDMYDIFMDMTSDENVSVSINCRNKAAISYSGLIERNKEESKNKKR